LAAAGYRATREGHHYRIIQSLAYTIGAEADLIAKIDGFRKSATSVIMNDRVRFRFKKPEKCSFLPGSFGAPWPGGWKKIIRSFSRSELAQA
jgi:hypothetical protein